ncbi:hypothetical protein J8J27_35235, partial [Mycobacterium tuberculosis]|nr:hypothetical protein [Mycobacterium tuberculosis]
SEIAARIGDIQTSTDQSATAILGITEVIENLNRIVGTIAGAVKVLKDAGAGDVIIATTHGIFSDPAAERLANCGAKE